MLSSLLVIAPPALHPRTAAMLGDSATLHFLHESVIGAQCTLQIPADSVDRCYIELPDPTANVHASFMPELMRVLKKGAKICVRHRNGFKWTDSLVFSGFVDAVQKDGDGVMLETFAAKPHWDSGAAMPLALKKKTAPAATATAPKPQSVWKISADDGDELMDEDALLNPADLQPTQPRPAPSDCEVSEGKKACKNCTCGRAEMENTEANTSTATATSACGSCYLGDAFRCASCPYKGLPPFKPGEQVIISTD